MAKSPRFVDVWRGHWHRVASQWPAQHWSGGRKFSNGSAFSHVITPKAFLGEAGTYTPLFQAGRPESLAFASFPPSPTSFRPEPSPFRPEQSSFHHSPTSFRPSLTSSRPSPTSFRPEPSPCRPELLHFGPRLLHFIPRLLHFVPSLVHLFLRLVHFFHRRNPLKFPLKGRSRRSTEAASPGPRTNHRD